MRLSGGAEDGFTLVEAVVALSLFVVVLVATGTAAVRALEGVGSTDRAVAATLLAGRALEQARSVSAREAPDGSSALTAGRTPDVVDPVDVTDLRLSDTRTAYGAASPGGPTVPVTTTQTVDGTPFTVRVVIGTCTRDAAGGPCDLGTGHVTPRTLYRVVSAVTWPGCRPGQCPVTATTLLDPAPDASFNALQDVLPAAHDKCWSTAPGTPLTFDPTYKSYTLRDTGDLGNAPVQLVTAPDHGTLTQNTGSATWTYTPDAGSYTTQFTYRLIDRYSRLSDPAVITLEVGERHLLTGARQREAGLSLVELVIAMAVTSLLLAALATALVGLVGAYGKVQDTQLADDRGRVVLDRLDRDLRQASAVNPAGVAGGAAYVEYQIDVGAPGAPSSCTQWRLDATTHVLAVRRWTLPPRPGRPAWTDVVSGVVNDLTADPPFQVTPAQGVSTRAQLTVQLRLALAHGQALTRATVAARNSTSGSAAPTPVCLTYGRS